MKKRQLHPPHGDIAIVGLALRLPGADDLDTFWDHLSAGRSLITEVPADRWRKEDFHGDPRRGHNKTASIWGGFVEQADCFDAEFFRISPREAQSMDPQQRFALELSWQALEDAGYRPGALAGTRTGVYMGVCHWDYAELYEKAGQGVDAYFPTGTAYSIIANRVSHFFDFNGPSITNDTACSASLVAVYQAVRALQAGECSAALAGGVNLCWSPSHFIAFSKNGMLSKEGKSKAFDADADGYVRGEGGGVLVLKRLADAEAAGDAIYAVIKGIGSNHGGKTNALTVTSPAAQAALIADVYAAAGVAPESVSYIEAHGPGTPVGDPIEILGLKKAFARDRGDSAPVPAPWCGIGSVKTNIGHLEGAAGVAGMIKVMAAMAQRRLPATVHFKQLNPIIKLDGSPFYIVGTTQDWNPAALPRRAGVSAFGFGGTNAHVLLEEYRPHGGKKAKKGTREEPAAGPALLTLSARTAEQLRQMAARLLAWRQRHDAADLVAVAASLQRGREAMAERLALLVEDWAEAAAKLAAFAAGQVPESGCWRGTVGEPSAPVLAEGELARWQRKQKWARLASFWVQGGAVDWDACYPKHRPPRVHLPAYPFARVRHWFAADGRVEATPPGRPATAAVPAADAAVPATLHPLLHRNQSTLQQHRYRSEFSGREFFLADHVVAGQPILPGVAYLEMLRAAVIEALGGESAVPQDGLRLQHVVWLRPLPAAAGVAVDVTLAASADGHINCRVSAVASGDVHGEAVAVLQPSAEPLRLDLAVLQAQLAADAALPARCYEQLAAAGIVHGPGLRGLDRLQLGAGQVLARLQVPAAAGGDGRYQLHPTLLDSAIQACVLLLPTPPERPALPFALQELVIHGRCPPAVWALAKLQPGSRPDLPKFDLLLADDTGRVLVEMRGLATRLLDDARPERPGPVVAAPALIYTRRAWQPAPARDQQDPRPCTVLLALPEADAAWVDAVRQAVRAEVLALPVPAAAEAWPTSLETACNQLLERLRAVQAARAKARFCVVLRDGVAGNTALLPLAALFRTAAAESDRVSGKLLCLPGPGPLVPQQVVAALQAELRADDADCEVRISAAGQREVRRSVEFALPGGDVPIRPGGVYWITGGAGGLGRQLAAHLAGRGAGAIVLSGRSPEANLAGLPTAGSQIVYLPADVSRAEEARRVVEEIRRRFGALHGVVHAAGVLRDAFILNKTPAEVAAVLAPKVAGTLAIDAATRDCPLDFLLLFSSVAAVHGNAGQADYGVANAFLDAFAEYRNAEAAAGRRPGRTVSINWPLWAGGGMQLDAAGIAAMARRTGLQPLPVDAGLAALDAILGRSAAAQVGVAYGDQAAYRRFLGERPAPAVAGTAAAAPAPAADDKALKAGALALAKRTLAEVLKLDAGQLKANEKFERYGFDSIMAVEMTHRLEPVFGPLPKTLFFEYVDLDGIAGYLLAEHRAKLAAHLAPAAEPATSPAAVAAPAAGAAVAVPAGVPVPTPEPRRPSDDYHDIAVIGVAGRYPGADTLEQLWDMLAAGRHAFEKVPPERWNHRHLYFSERDILGKSTIRNGAFLKDIDRFDPRYFNISQRDAELMSPEVRLFLEVGVEAFEDAGYSREELQRRYGGDVGVLVGTMSNHYNLYGFQNALTRGARASGSYTGTLPNMLSYFYGFTGPSIFLDTMCSAAATCIDQGVHLLRSRQCRMVLAGGVNLLLHPYNLVSSSQEHFTTKTSELIRSYGQGADGTILGEGVGAVLLKPLAEAERDGDAIYAVIKGTALSNAGIRNGFTVPNPGQQARAIEKALDDAGIDARTISYVEGHGSGTRLGDPIEIKALAQAYRRHTTERGFCPIGSVKSNVAHLLAAAGVAGFTKVLLQLQHRQIAPSLHAEVLNESIDFAATPFYVQRELADWPQPVLTENGIARRYPRRAGITSIGAGGMNSHIIVEEHPPAAEHAWYGPAGPIPAPATRSDQLFVFSALNRRTLDALAARFAAHLRQRPDIDPAALAYTLQVGRTELPCRLAVRAADLGGLLAALAEFEAAGEQRRGTAYHYQPSTQAAETAVDDQQPAADLAAGNLDAVAGHWTAGAAIDWQRLWPHGHPRRLHLPTYPFERVRCWYEVYDDAPSVLHPLAFQRKAHPFLGRNASDLQGVRYELDFRIDELLDYVFRAGPRQLVAGIVLDAALALPKLAGAGEGWRIARLQWGVLPDWSRVHRVEARLAAAADGYLAQFSWQDGTGASQVLAEAVYQPAAPAVPVRQDPAALQAQAGREVPRDAFYAGLRAAGLDYTPYLEAVDTLHALPGGRLLLRLAEPELQQDWHPAAVCLPPVVLGALQQLGQLAGREAGLERWAELAPQCVEDVAVAAAGGTATWVLAELAPAMAEAAVHGRIELLDAAGNVTAAIGHIHFAAAPLATGLPADGVRSVLSAAAAIPGMPAARTAQKAHAAAGTEAAPDLEVALTTTLRQRVADIVKFKLADIDLTTHFYAFGFDSIALTDLSNRLNAEFGTTLTPALFFEIETIGQLAGHLRRQCQPQLQQWWQAGAAAQAAGAEVRRATAVRAPARADAPAGAAAAPGISPASGGPHAFPVAIIGAACRFPGADDLDGYWRLLHDGVDAIGPLPLDRYHGAYREAVAAADFPKRGGFLAGLKRFDAAFFGVPPAEAALMDPQHRLWLETVWTAIEHAGYRAGRLPRRTGVFAGVSANDYAALLAAHQVPADGYTATGLSHAMLANRVSFLLDLQGPSEAIDTACSSSLVALHRAAESLRSGQCELAIAGGVNVALSLDTFVGPQRAGMLSADGRCHTFSAQANGYVRGEGAGAVLLKPLAAAERDGDTILGVLIASAENHGGRASSLTAPNATAQAELVEQALAGIDSASISYIETHGTGTALGDPVEINGLKLAFERRGRAAGHPSNGGDPWCGLGSVKTQIGHLEAAAGIAGVIKVLLALQHQQLPANLHGEPVNPYIELAGSPFYLVDTRRPWPDLPGRLPRRAGVSSFGFGGANAHVVIEAYRHAEAVPVPPPGPALIVLSARSPDRLRVAAERLLAYVRNLSPVSAEAEQPLLHALAATLQLGREPMEERLGFAANSMAEVAAGLQSFLAGAMPSAGLYRGTLPRPAGRVVVARRDDGEAGASARVPAAGTAEASLAAWVAGQGVAWESLYPGPRPRRLALPGYPFGGAACWFTGESGESAAAGALEGVLDRVVDEQLSIEVATALVERLLAAGAQSWR